ncbi:MAG: futalosine hydrolase [Haliscomenobacteraceae bacterium CHB4]|nr:5'-methylthioadenosine/S-adenosylhomocysteine nucleosidase [Saprospiraceae bacterium]MCE7922947.1 futalosine hydrolase [Haliscomenobacteraceae bacterium CHB4]
MQVLLVSATIFEVAPTLNWLEEHFEINEKGVFEKGGLSVFPLVTGVGTTATAFSLGQFLSQNQADLAINAGIAGAFDRNFRLGDVLNIATERFGDLGVEEADGRFTDLFELGLLEKNDPPFINGLLRNPVAEKAAFLPLAHGLTVHKVHGSISSVTAIQAKYPDAQVESMEGAAFFHACLRSQIQFLEIRSISNYVEARNREKWNLPLAINNLNQTLIAMLETFCPKP